MIYSFVTGRHSEKKFLQTNFDHNQGTFDISLSGIFLKRASRNDDIYKLIFMFHQKTSAQ